MGPVVESDDLAAGIVSSYTFLEVPCGILTSRYMTVKMIDR